MCVHWVFSIFKDVFGCCIEKVGMQKQWKSEDYLKTGTGPDQVYCEKWLMSTETKMA
jgi:hypothetical protein